MRRAFGFALLATIGGCTSILGDFSVGDAGPDASLEAGPDVTPGDVAVPDAPKDAPAADVGPDAPACGALNEVCCATSNPCNATSCCGGTCRDVTKDPGNCGSCGHKCPAGCAGGLCTPEPMYTSTNSQYPGRIRDAQSRLVWMDRDSSDGGQSGRVLVCDKQSCTPTVLMQGLDYLTDIVLDAPNFTTVWASNSSTTLYSCPIGGCNLTPAKTSVGTSSGTQGLAYRAGSLFSTLDLDAWQFRPDGTTVAELGTGNEPGNSYEAPPGTPYVYWNDFIGGTYQIRVGKDSSGSSATSFWSSATENTYLVASDAKYVAWIGNGSNGSTVYACAITFGQCTNPTTIAKNVQYPGSYEGALAIDPTNDDVLWTQASGNEVKVLACGASGGCNLNPKLIADVKTTNLATAGAVAADPNFYYFDMADGTNETLYRIGR